MRRAGTWTTLRYRLRRVSDRLAYWWACLCAAVEELSMLLGRRPRIDPPPRLGLHVPGRSPGHAARRITVDPRFSESRDAQERGEA